MNLAFTSLIGEKVRDGERSLPYAFIASGGQIGLLLVGSAGSWIGRTYKWDLLFELIGLLSFLWIIILYKMNREYNSSYKYNFQYNVMNHLIYPVSLNIKVLHLFSVIQGQKIWMLQRVDYP